MHSRWGVVQSFPSGFEGEEANVVEQVLHYLQSLEREPTVGDLWFALPQFVAGTSDA